MHIIVLLDLYNEIYNLRIYLGPRWKLHTVIRSKSKSAPLAVPGLSVKTTVSSSRTSSCKLDSSQSTGRTWVSRTPTRIKWNELLTESIDWMIFTVAFGMFSQVACTCSTATRRPPSSWASPRPSPARTRSWLISAPSHSGYPACCCYATFWFSASL